MTGISVVAECRFLSGFTHSPHLRNSVSPLRPFTDAAIAKTTDDAFRRGLRLNIILQIDWLINGGFRYWGMQQTVVNPPLAAASVPLAIVSSPRKSGVSPNDNVNR